MLEAFEIITFAKRLPRQFYLMAGTIYGDTRANRGRPALDVRTREPDDDGFSSGSSPKLLSPSADQLGSNK